MAAASQKCLNGCEFLNGPPGLGSKATRYRRSARIRARIVARLEAPECKEQEPLWFTLMDDVILQMFWDDASTVAAQQEIHVALGTHTLQEAKQLLARALTCSSNND